MQRIHIVLTLDPNEIHIVLWPKNQRASKYYKEKHTELCKMKHKTPQAIVSLNKNLRKDKQFKGFLPSGRSFESLL